MDTSKTLTSSVFRFFSGTFLSRLSGLGREVAMAAFFGTTPLVASFWMAFRFAHLLRRLFGEGALHVAFVPHFESLRKKDPQEAARFFYTLTTHLAFLLVLLTLLIELFLSAWLFWASPSASTAEVLRLTMILLPSLVFICLHAANSSFLQCETRFFLSSASPVILNLTWVATLLFLWKKTPETMIHILSVVVVFGFILQWLVTQIPAKRFLKNTLGEMKRTLGARKEMWALLRPFLLSMGGVAATQVNSALDALFARAADPEGPALLWYAIRIEQLPLALLGVALSGALLPAISRAAERGEKQRYLEFVNLSLRRVGAFMLPITFAIFAIGFASVTLLYGRGEFAYSSIQKTTHCLWAYGAGLFPQTAVLILASAFYALKEYRLPTLFSCLSVVVNIVLNALFVYGFGWGALSVAIATAIAAFVNAFLLAWALYKRQGNYGLGLLPSYGKILGCSLLAAAVTVALSPLLFTDPFPQKLTAQLTRFATETLFFGLSLLVSASLLGAKDLIALIPTKEKIRNLI